MDSPREQERPHLEPFMRLPQSIASTWTTFCQQSWEVLIAVGIITAVLIGVIFEDPFYFYFYFTPRDVSIFAVKTVCAAMVAYFMFKVAIWLEGAGWTLFPVFGARSEDERIVYEKDTPHSTPLPTDDPARSTANDIQIPPTPHLPSAFRRQPRPPPAKKTTPEHHSGIIGPSPYPNKSQHFQRELGFGDFAKKKRELGDAADRASYYTLNKHEKRMLD